MVQEAGLARELDYWVAGPIYRCGDLSCMPPARPNLDMVQSRATACGCTWHVEAMISLSSASRGSTGLGGTAGMVVPWCNYPPSAVFEVSHVSTGMPRGSEG